MAGFLPLGLGAKGVFMSRPSKTLQPLLILCVIVLFLLFPACGGPSGPAQGSPEWLYLAARDSFRGGDIDKTQVHLEKIVVVESPFQARAAAWDLLIKNGRLLGYEDLVESYHAGWLHAVGPNKLNFARDHDTMLKEIRGYGLHLLEANDHFQKIAATQKLDHVDLEFPWPDGSAAPVVEIERMEKGIWPVDTERELAQSKMLQRGMLRGISAGITAPDDVPGAQKAMASGKTSVPLVHFQWAIANAMSTTAKYFGEHYIAESDKRKIFLENTVETVKKVLDLKPDADIEKAAKKLQADAEKDLKKIK
jgi:hypothetical protein